jgi:hypothetical protein
MEPTRLLAIIALLSLVTVEYGGWALLGFFTGRGSLGGILAQSGGFFLHLAVGHEGQRSPGTIMTRTGALLIAVALLILAAGLLTSG